MSDAKNKPATKNLNPSVSSCYIESCDGSLWAQFWAQWVIWLTKSWRGDHRNLLKKIGAKGGSRTPMGVTPPDPKSGASANSATFALKMSSAVTLLSEHRFSILSHRAGSRKARISIVPPICYTFTPFLTLPSCLGSSHLWVGAWRSLVARLLWEQEVGGSNPSAPTIYLRSIPDTFSEVILTRKEATCEYPRRGPQDRRKRRHLLYCP